MHNNNNSNANPTPLGLADKTRWDGVEDGMRQVGGGNSTGGRCVRSETRRLKPAASSSCLLVDGVPV